jgi:hypothetical protein
MMARHLALKVPAAIVRTVSPWNVYSHPTMVIEALELGRVISPRIPAPDPAFSSCVFIRQI